MGKTYGTKKKSVSIHGRIQSYQRDESAQQSKRATRKDGRGQGDCGFIIYDKAKDINWQNVFSDERQIDLLGE